MSIYKNNNKLNSYIIVLITLFILILVTKDEFNILQEKLDLKETSNLTLVEKRLELEELNNKKIELSNSSENIDKYLLNINEDELVDYIYSYIEDTNDVNGVIMIKSVSISEPKDTEIWFKERIVTLNLRVPNEDKTKKLLDFLTSADSKYNFFVSSFSFPYDKAEWGYNISIPLKVLNK